MKIKFNKDYMKFPPLMMAEMRMSGEIFNNKVEKIMGKGKISEFKTYIIGVTGIPDVRVLPKAFIDYDTMAIDGKNYMLDEKQRYLLITLFTTHSVFGMGSVWTTLREWTPENEKKYKSALWQEVDIEINGQV